MNLKSCPPYPLGKIKRSAVDQPFPAMKLLIVFLLLFCLSNATAAVYGQQITLHLKDTPLEKAFDEIQKQSGFTFLYKDTEIANIKVTANIEKATLANAIEKCLATQSLSYEIVGKIVVIKKRASIKTKQLTSLPSVLIDIRGIVTDSTGKPLPGAVIRIKGSNQSTITKTNGYYELKQAPLNSVLVFSMTGYNTIEKSINESTYTTINITLKIFSGTLNQVSIVSTGYQQIPKERATGSFDQIDNALINRSVTTNILDRLWDVPDSNLK